MTTTIRNRLVLWSNNSGVHQCEGADIHPGVRLLWTLCEIDVPANAAWLPRPEDSVSCSRCIAAIVGKGE